MTGSVTKARLVVVDGKPSRGENFVAFAFSPDGSRFAYVNSGTPARVVLDGTQGPEITFTPDDKHLAWIGQRPGVPRQLVFIDGEPVLEVDQTQGVQNEAQVYTAVAADGVFTVVAQTLQGRGGREKWARDVSKHSATR